jgi:predicted MFS family arabinose efflux permease
MGMAPMTMSPLAAWLVTHHDWRTAMLMISALAAAIMIPVAFLIRRPPALANPGAAAVADADSAPEMSRGQALRSPQFLILLLTNFFCCATHSGPIFHTVSYAVTCGIPLILAVSIYSVEGLAGLGGRIAFGVLGDRLGAKRVLVAGLLVQALGTLGYLAARELATFYTVAAFFGFIYAGVMPLYSVIARENFPLRMMGTVIGGMVTAGGLGMATGPVTGGLIYDSFGSYSGLFVMSFCLGIGAFLIALTFKPFPRNPPVPEPA